MLLLFFVVVYRNGKNSVSFSVYLYDRKSCRKVYFKVTNSASVAKSGLTVGPL